MVVTAQKKLLKKFWFPVMAPNIFDNVKIGESYIAEPEVLKGRTINIGLAHVLNDQRLRNINAKFIIKEVNEKALTEIIGLELSQGYLRRLVKHDKDRIDQSFTAKTSDGKVVRIKPFMVTKTSTKGSILAALRKGSEQRIKQYLSKMKYDTLVKNVVTTNFQRIVKSDLDKIYPLKTFEVRMLQHVADEAPIGEEDLSMFKDRQQRNQAEVKKEEKPEVKEEKVEEKKEEQ